jgi:hypothetical protein
MNLGAVHATGNVLLFLHAYTVLPEGRSRSASGTAPAARLGPFR